jgi:SOS response associated peptidase (SRAP)
LADDDFMVMAGLWDEWISPSGERVKSCTVITTEPNDVVGALHDRMQVVPEEGRGAFNGRTIEGASRSLWFTALENLASRKARRQAVCGQLIQALLRFLGIELSRSNRRGEYEKAPRAKVAGLSLSIGIAAEPGGSKAGGCVVRFIEADALVGQRSGEGALDKGQIVLRAGNKISQPFSGETLIAVRPAICARGARRSHLTKPYTVAAAAVVTMTNNSGALTAIRAINCPNQVIAGKGVNICTRAAVTTTKIT